VLNDIKRWLGFKLLTYADPVEGHDYVLVVDVSAGLGRDYHCAHVIDISVRPFDQVAVFRDNTLKAEDLALKLAEIGDAYNGAPILVENNNGGLALYHLEQTAGYEAIIFTTEASKRDGPARASTDVVIGGGRPGTVGGVRCTTDVKRLGLAIIKWLLEHDELRINDRMTADELSTFQRNPKAKTDIYEALPGHHDDAVSALLLFGWLTETEGHRLDWLRAMKASTGGAAPLFFLHDDGRRIETGLPAEMLTEDAMRLAAADLSENRDRAFCGGQRFEWPKR
jgi:hypothetical protein